mgnify:CR=1 FL=1
MPAGLKVSFFWEARLSISFPDPSRVRPGLRVRKRCLKTQFGTGPRGLLLHPGRWGDLPVQPIKALSADLRDVGGVRNIGLRARVFREHILVFCVHGGYILAHVVNL